MSFGHSTADMHCIMNFTEAEELYNRLDPIRGYSKEREGVPMQTNRTNWKNKYLRKLDNDTYAVVHHYTNVITFNRDGNIQFDLGYNSPTTREYVDAIGYWNFSVNQRDNEQVFSFGVSSLCSRQEAQATRASEEAAPYHCEFLMHEGAFTMRRVKTGWQIDADDIMKAQKRTVDRKKSKVIRASFAALTDVATFFIQSPMSLDVYHELRRKSSNYFNVYNFVRNWKSGYTDIETIIAEVIAAYHEQADYNHKTLDRGEVFFDFTKMKREIYEAAYDRDSAYKYATLPWGVLPRSLKTVRFI